MKDYDDEGDGIWDVLDRARVAAMFQPVRCGHCCGVYDLGKVTVTARYVDCSVWTTPCCKRSVDDRGPYWSSGVEVYTRLPQRGGEDARR